MQDELDITDQKLRISEHKLGINVGKQNNFSEWYTEIVKKCNLIEYTDISGCYVLTPPTMKLWKRIQDYLDAEFTKLSVENAYFPLLISKDNLAKEEDHIEGFKAEVAWLEAKENERKLAIRPTSECAMYPVFANMIRNSLVYRMPLKINQWCSVVRWEFTDCIPFIRSREFLWQEGHTCYSSLDESLAEVDTIIDVYEQTYKNLMAIPVIKGEKTPCEKFAGAYRTKTVEVLIPGTGRGVQAATAHSLGQNFSKMFGIRHNDEYVWQNSWGFTTRSIGLMLMIHGDNRGMVMPPYIAHTQFIIVPIYRHSNKDIVNQFCEKVNTYLIENKFRGYIDYRDKKPGWKRSYTELHGIPLRIEIGENEVNTNNISVNRRDKLQRKNIAFTSDLYNNISALLEDINNTLYEYAKTSADANIVCPNNIEEFSQAMSNNNICYINWCGSAECKNTIKDIYYAKPLCIPTQDPRELKSGPCCICSSQEKYKVLVGKGF